MYPTFQILGVSIPLFNLILGVAIITGFLIYEKEATAFEYAEPFVHINKEIIFLFLIVTGFLSAAFFENIFHNDFSRIGKYGITFYGGFLTAILTNIILMKFSFNRFILFANIAVPSLIIAHSIGRIGCFMGGCCYGKLTTSFFSITYPNGESRIPIPLIESALLFLIYWFIKKRVSFDNRFLNYLFIYPIVRFFLEFFRDDNRGSIMNIAMSPAQIISILLLSILLLFTYSTSKKSIR
jgi:phosphatidylglycerol:prolipoprotein diacylglycerol transferase